MAIKSLTPFLLILTVLPVDGIERNSIFRFHRLLRQYDQPDYRASDRDIFADIEYSGQTREEKPRYSTVSREGSGYQSYYLDFSDTLGFTGRRLRSSSTKQSDQKLMLSLSGAIDRRSEVTDNSLTGFNSTSSDEYWKACGSIKYSGAIRRYSRLSFLHKLLFLELNTNADVSGVYYRDRHFTHNVDRYSDSTYMNTARSRNAGGGIGLRPAVGYGKRLPVAPIYKAFEIERKLKKAGALRSDLSDTTLMKLAQLCGSLESFRVNHDRPDKYVMRQLEKIVSGDSAVDSVQLQAFALFKAYETFSEQMPLLFKGFEVKLRADADLYYYYYLNSNSDRYSDPNPYQALTIDLDFMNPLELEWTLPVVSRLFIELGIGPRYDCSNNPLRFDGTIGAYFFITDFIVAHASISEIPVYIAAPYDTPDRFELETDIFLEDHFSLKIKCFKHINDYCPGWYVRKVDEGVSLRVNYDF
ncbi:MAG: hypothetical protein JW913_12950 [Chitinispirillaceae bacterium]|nr:hypothetical protein [Chitinispirillaceae bacterium]